MSPLGPTWQRPVLERSHVQSLLRYFLTQASHHELSAHPALHEGSCLPDLLGARRLDGYAPSLPDILPRLGPGAILECVGLGTLALDPIDLSDIRRLGALRLLGATERALAAGPGLRGREATQLRARAALFALARATEIPSSEIAFVAQIPLRTVQRLAAGDADPEQLTAIRRCLALEERAARAIPAARPGVVHGSSLALRARTPGMA